MEFRPTTFAAFWPFYVSQHLDPTNRALHFVGTALSLGALGAGVVFPPALLAAPVCGYGFAWIGHFVVEKNRPATFTYPVWSLLGDYKMFGLTLLGKMGPELERARAFVASQTAADDGAAAQAA